MSKIGTGVTGSHYAPDDERDGSEAQKTGPAIRTEPDGRDNSGRRPVPGSGVVEGSGAGAGGGGAPEEHDDDPVNGGGERVMPGRGPSQ